MAEVKNPTALFKVELTEYERGWGQKPWEDKFFDNEAEARKILNKLNRDYNNKVQLSKDGSYGFLFDFTA